MDTVKKAYGYTTPSKTPMHHKDSRGLSHRRGRSLEPQSSDGSTARSRRHARRSRSRSSQRITKKPSRRTLLTALSGESNDSLEEDTLAPIELPDHIEIDMSVVKRDHTIQQMREELRHAQRSLRHLQQKVRQDRKAQNASNLKKQSRNQMKLDLPDLSVHHETLTKPLRRPSLVDNVQGETRRMALTDFLSSSKPTNSASSLRDCRSATEQSKAHSSIIRRIFKANSV